MEDFLGSTLIPIVGVTAWKRISQQRDSSEAEPHHRGRLETVVLMATRPFIHMKFKKKIISLYNTENVTIFAFVRIYNRHSQDTSFLLFISRHNFV